MLLKPGESVVMDRLRADTVISVNSVVSHHSQLSARSELSCLDDPMSQSETTSDAEEFYDAVEARSRSGSQSRLKDVCNAAEAPSRSGSLSHVRERSDTQLSNHSDVGLLWGQLGGESKGYEQAASRPSIKQSRILCVMLLLNVLIMYLMRVNLSFAISTGPESIVREHDWDSNQQGIVLSAFFWG